MLRTPGMLWFDNSEDRNLIEKVSRAAQYYVTKYRKVPKICFLHPSMLAGTAQVRLWTVTLETVEGEIVVEMEVYAANSVLPNHFWLGMETGGKVA